MDPPKEILNEEMNYIKERRDLGARDNMSPD